MAVRNLRKPSRHEIVYVSLLREKYFNCLIGNNLLPVVEYYMGPYLILFE